MYCIRMVLFSRYLVCVSVYMHMVDVLGSAHRESCNDIEITIRKRLNPVRACVVRINRRVHVVCFKPTDFFEFSNDI